MPESVARAEVVVVTVVVASVAPVVELAETVVVEVDSVDPVVVVVEEELPAITATSPATLPAIAPSLEPRLATTVAKLATFPASATLLIAVVWEAAEVVVVAAVVAT